MQYQLHVRVVEILSIRSSLVIGYHICSLLYPFKQSREDYVTVRVYFRFKVYHTQSETRVLVDYRRYVKIHICLCNK